MDFLSACSKLRKLLNFCWPFQDLEEKPNFTKLYIYSNTTNFSNDTPYSSSNKKTSTMENYVLRIRSLYITFKNFGLFEF